MDPATASTAANSGASLRARLRAAAITVALLVQCTSALPHRAFNEARLARPEGQRLVSWIERALGLAGVRPERDAIARELMALSRAGIRARNAALAPFGAFFHYSGTHQQWALFITPRRESFRLHVEARPRRGAWTALYRAPNPRGPIAELLRYRRVRGIYNPGFERGVTDQYRGFVRFVSAAVFARYPEYDRVRVRFERIQIGEPGMPARSLGFEHAVTRRRGQGA